MKLEDIEDSNNLIKDSSLIEETTPTKQKKLTEADNEINSGEYNPSYDYESQYPIYLRLIKFFDIFNNMSIVGRKRTRYYNDSGIEQLNIMKLIFMLFLIFNGVTNTLISLPQPDLYDSDFHKSKLYFFLYKISINSLTCLIILEAACGTYKLMKYILKEYKNYIIIINCSFSNF